MRNTNLKHGHSRKGRQSKEYRSWAVMIQRCTNPAVDRYPRYGGRGIRVCDRWIKSFESFLADMGPCPSPEHSIDRKDNDGNYELGNCRWATVVQQVRNRSSNRIIEFNGESRTAIEWSEVLGIPYDRLKGRIKHGYPVEMILYPGKFIPIKNRTKKGLPARTKEDYRVLRRVQKMPKGILA